MSKKANTVATVLIIAALLVTAGVLTQREIYPSKSSALQRTLNAFARNVYESPDDMIERYAQNGFQFGRDSVWYCSDYASPPDLAKTKDDFSLFATSNLEGSIASLIEEYPEYEIEVTRPIFELLGPDLIEDLPHEIVSVSVSNLTVTIRDGDRLIQTNFDQDQDYAYRFWYMYKVMQAWIKCDNGGIFGIVENTLEDRSCAFFKDQCFCAQFEWSEDNTCPCGRTLPLYTEEDCSQDDPTKCQDFTNTERETLKQQYGIDKFDLQEMGDGISDILTQTFDGQSICTGMDVLVPSPTGITCTARVENPQTENHFRSSYAYHPTGCVEQVDGTCGVVAINTFDSLKCGGAPTCPSASVLGRPDLISQWIALINTNNPPSTCQVVDKVDDDGNPYQVVECNGVVIGGDGIPALPWCTWDETFDHSTQGIAGEDPTAPSAGLICNPRPPDADPGPGDVSSGPGALDAGDPDIKSIVPDSLWWKNGKDFRYLWFGANGWLDRRGAFDLSITCSDPGVLGTRPLQSTIRLHVVFRHGCDADQGRMRGWAPPMCGAPGVGNQQNCDLPCNDNPCIREQCEFIVPDDPTSGMHCVEIPGNPITRCILPDNPCMESDCIVPAGSESPICDPNGNLQPKTGVICGPEGRDKPCSVCNNAGQCVPRPPEEEYPCSMTSSNRCKQAQCIIQTSGGNDVGRCALVDKPPESPCGASGCGECLCSPTCGTESGPCREEWSEVNGACDGQSETYWTSCRDQVTIDKVCDGTPSSGYQCETPPGSPSEFNTDVCCPPVPAPTSDPCTGPGQTCCQESFCTDNCVIQ